jgi:hypothetical protein
MTESEVCFAEIAMNLRLREIVLDFERLTTLRAPEFDQDAPSGLDSPVLSKS